MNIESIYNTGFAVKKYVTDLNTLNEIMDFRHNKGYNENERMSEFKILDDYIWFDTCGNALIKVGKDSYSPIYIPKESDKCPVCGKGWNIHNLEDCSTHYDYDKKEHVCYHKQCNFINNLNKKHKEFTGIFEQVYSSGYSFKVIPNEYCQCEVCAPWFVFHTNDGDIKIGWRKHVICIQWLDSCAKFSETFDTEDVTKWNDETGRGIHAWSVDKCVEYLRRAKNSIA